MSFHSVSRKISLYLCSNVLRNWGDAVLYYIIMATLLNGNQHGYLITLVLTAPIALHAFFSPLLAHYFEHIKDQYRQRYTLLFRVLLTLFAGVITYGLFNNYAPTTLVGFVIVYKFFDMIDEIIHAPIPFIMSQTKGLNLLGYRMLNTLLVRGANVITPTIALAAAATFVGSFTTIIPLLVFGIIASFMVGNFTNRPAKDPSLSPNNTMDNPQRREPAITHNDKIIMWIYAFMMLLLNIAFANTAIILLKYHVNEHDIFATMNASFFIGFVGITFITMWLSKPISNWFTQAKKVIWCITLTTFIIAVCYIGFYYLPEALRACLMILIGSLYAVNLFLVCTILPGLLSLSNIFKKMNYGMLAGNIGMVFSSLLIGWFIENHFNAPEMLRIMGFIGIIVGCIFIPFSFYAKKA